MYRSQSYWLDSVRGRLEPRPALTGEQTADVLIVGAGYTGLWTAYYLKTHAPHLDIAILEADIAGFGASGRNGGWCSAYLSGIDQWLEDANSRDSAIALQRHMFATVDEIGRVSCLENIECDFDKSGHVSAAVNASQWQREREAVEYWRGLGFDDEDMRLLDASEVHAKAHVHGVVGGAFMPHCAAIQPAALARGLARAVVKKGVRLYERSPVLELDGQSARTPGGQIKSEATLLATEGFTGTISGLNRRLLPVHSLMIATEPLTDEEIEATGLQRRHTWNDGRHLVTYGQLTRDKRIAFGSRGSYYWGSRIRTQFDRGEKLITEVRQALADIFPVLQDKAISHAWGGPMGVSRDLLPAVVWDKNTRYGWAGGYFGDGVGAANLAGRTLADLVLSRDTDRTHTPWVNPEGSEAPPQQRWEPEPLRWLAVAARYRVMHLADEAETANRSSAARWNAILENVFP